MRWFIFLSVTVSLGAEFRTPNFHITAADPNMAELVGKWAEHHRRAKAVQWLGKEMPTWAERCTLAVNVTMETAQGKTTFVFGSGQVASMEMSMSGPLDRLVNSVLPHEMTHTVFAYHCRCPVPRWADEGGAILSEDAEERERHRGVARKLLEAKKLFRLRVLMPMYEYPNDIDGIMALYSQGFAVSDYLVKHRDNLAFLNFVAEGVRTKNWDGALKSSYGFEGIDELEESWLRYMKNKRPRTAALPFRLELDRNACVMDSPLEISPSWLARRG